MPKVQLKIEVNDNAESEKLGDITNQVNGEGSNANVSNVSIEATDSGIYVIGAMNKNGREMLSFGEDGNLVFNIDGFLSSNGVKAGALASEQDPDMFVWGVVPASKEYHVKLTFINAKNLREIVVYGDPVANQFPTEAIVNGTTTIYSDDNRWAINLGSESTTHTIEFTKWNRADYNACLTLIKVMLRYFEIGNHTGLLDVESLSQSNAQPKEIMYGLVPSTGTARINVFDELRDLIEEGIITNNKNAVEIFVDGKKVQHHITTDSDYENNRVLTMDFENYLSFLDGIYAGRNLTDPMSAYDLLSEVLGTLNYTKIQIDSMLDKEIVYGNNESGSVKSYLENITIEYPYLESATYRETLDKFCVLAQLNLLEDDNGNLKFVSARPVDIKGSEIISIPVNRQFSTFSKDEFVKNKYVNPFVQYCKFIGEESLFGETKNATYREDTESTYLNEFYDGNEFIVSSYKEVYNDNEKNALSNNTILYNDYEEGYQENCYKTHVIMPISKDVIKKYNEKTFVSITGSRTGTNSEISKIDNELKQYYPYKSSNYSVIAELKDHLLPNFRYVKIQNVNIQKEFIEFDILFQRMLVLGYKDETLDRQLSILNATFQLYGTTYKYEFLNSEKTSDIEISGNELIQEGTLYKGSRKLYELNKDNIASDYGSGVRTSRVSVACLDYYNTNGELAIDWNKRQMLKVGDIVRVDKDNNGNSIAKYSNGEPYLWKVVGRNFRYSGVPMIDLELQEVKLIEPNDILEEYYISATVGTGATLILDRVSSPNANAPLGKISVNDALYYGDVVKISWTLDSGYATDTAYLNGEKIYSFEEHQITITSNNTIVINTKATGYQTIWSGEYTYRFEDLTNNESVIELPTSVNGGSGLRLTFEKVTLFNVSDGASADEITNITREIPFTLSSEFGNWWNSKPSITFEHKQISGGITNQLKTIRIAGNYDGTQYMVGSFKLTKIEQYID